MNEIPINDIVLDAQHRVWVGTQSQSTPPDPSARQGVSGGIAGGATGVIIGGGVVLGLLLCFVAFFVGFGIFYTFFLQQ